MRKYLIYALGFLLATALEVWCTIFWLTEDHVVVWACVTGVASVLYACFTGWELAQWWKTR